MKQAKEVCTIFCDDDAEALVIMIVSEILIILSASWPVA